MIYLEGLKKIEKISWKDIQPGMVYLGGVRINDAIPFELRDFPVLSRSFLDELLKKYYFLSGRDILVAKAETGYSPSKLSRNLKQVQAVLDKVNVFRGAYLREKEKILNKYRLPLTIDDTILSSDYVEKNYFIFNKFNSFKISESIIDQGNIPSFFNSLSTHVSLGHLLTGELRSVFNFPKDEKVLLHLVADFSYSMGLKGKMDIMISCLQFMHNVLSDFLLNTEIKVYAFSDECHPVSLPLKGKEMPKRGTQYSSFIKKVLHFKDISRYNKVILFSDGVPTDFSDALHYGRLFKKNNIDFTQIIFNVRDQARFIVESVHPSVYMVDNVIDESKIPPDAKRRNMSDNEWKQHLVKIARELTRFIETCGGNQVMLKMNDIVPIIALECFDRYLGLITCLDPQYIAVKKKRIENNIENQEVVIRNGDGKKMKKKIIKKWHPKIIRRGG